MQYDQERIALYSALKMNSRSYGNVLSTGVMIDDQLISIGFTVCDNVFGVGPRYLVLFWIQRFIHIREWNVEVSIVQSGKTEDSETFKMIGSREERLESVLLRIDQQMMTNRAYRDAFKTCLHLVLEHVNLIPK